MTTIVFDRRTKTLVADTRGTKGGLKTRITKLRALPNGGFFAGCGNHSICLQVFDWVVAGSKPADKPNIDPEMGAFEAIVVKADGTAYVLESRLMPIEVEDDFAAIGSGGDFAMGAMKAGKGALEAAQIAADLDAFTGGPFHVVQLGQDSPAKPKRVRKKKEAPTP